MTKRYYNLHLLDNDGPVAETHSSHDFLQYFELPNIKKLAYQFVVIESNLEDYLANDLGFPLMSQKMKNIFDNHQGFIPSWTEVNVLIKKENVMKEYYILSFRSKPDVLVKSKCRFDGQGSVLIPFFSISAIEKIDYFPQPNKYDFNIVVSEGLKNVLVDHRITGIDFSKAKTG